MKRLSLFIMALLPLLAQANPASQVAWTPETLNLVRAGNSEAGKKLADSCQSCHGTKGEGKAAEKQDDEVLPAIPALAGQTANYLFKQLRDYADASRIDMTMNGIAKGLTEQQAADLSVYFSNLPVAQTGVTSSQNLAKAKILVNDGDGKRILPQCFVCHGSSGRGEKMDSPALAGQHADTIARALQAYKTGSRHNDIYSRMRLIAKQLTDEEIEQLGQYYQQMR